MTYLDELLVVAFGAVFGSFGGVLYSRTLLGKSTLWGSSACENCGQRILWRDKLPVLSFLWLKGRCSNCNERIPGELFLVEVITSLLFLLTYSIFHLNLISFQLFAIAIFTTPLVLIDIKTLRLPNKLTYTLLTLVTLQLLVGVIFFKNNLNVKDLGYVIVVVTFYLLLNLLTRGNFGMGDVKLSIPLALASSLINPASIFFSSICAFYSGGIYGLLQLLRGRRKYKVAFGPFMLFGFWVSSLLPQSTAEWVVSFWTP